MSTMRKAECPPDIQRLWEVAEAKGFSNFLWMPEHGVLMADLPNAGFEDDRVPVTWDMYELQERK